MRIGHAVRLCGHILGPHFRPMPTSYGAPSPLIGTTTTKRKEQRLAARITATLGLGRGCAPARRLSPTNRRKLCIQGEIEGLFRSSNTFAQLSVSGISGNPLGDPQ